MTPTTMNLAASLINLAPPRQRAPRSIAGPNLWERAQKTASFKATMVENGTAKKVHADSWIKDAVALEKLAGLLRVSANHVYNGTKPVPEMPEVSLPELSKEELIEMYIAQQKDFASYKRKTDRKLQKVAAAS